VETEYRMNAKFVASTLLRLFKQRATPEFVRSDNGPEFIAKHLMRVLATAGVTARHIEPGSPWQNGVDERFNGTLRASCSPARLRHSTAATRPAR
jgi:transposase InsO family protein